jgi:hypothetical protein
LQAMTADLRAKVRLLTSRLAGRPLGNKLHHVDSQGVSTQSGASYKRTNVAISVVERSVVALRLLVLHSPSHSPRHGR